MDSIFNKAGSKSKSKEKAYFNRKAFTLSNGNRLKRSILVKDLEKEFPNFIPNQMKTQQQLQAN